VRSRHFFRQTVETGRAERATSFGSEKLTPPGTLVGEAEAERRMAACDGNPSAFGGLCRKPCRCLDQDGLIPMIRVGRTEGEEFALDGKQRDVIGIDFDRCHA
jgi:hypothetical protein